tara:strand:+ start:15118 stop:21465 length:6348 start_codon:yes stop_codon:yes gene_type:complete
MATTRSTQIVSKTISPTTLDLISFEKKIVDFDVSKGDFMRVRVMRGETYISNASSADGGSIFDSNQPILVDAGDGNEPVLKAPFNIYRDKVTNKIFIKPKELLENAGFTSSANYTFVISFYRNILREIFIEPENLLKYSEEFSSDIWQKTHRSSVSIMYGEASPTEEETINCYELVEDGTTQTEGNSYPDVPENLSCITQPVGLHDYLTDNGLVPTGPIKNHHDYIFSVWVKSQDLPQSANKVRISLGKKPFNRSVLFDLIDDNILDDFDTQNSNLYKAPKITNWQNGWKRLEIHFHTDYVKDFELLTDGEQDIQSQLTDDMKYRVYIQLNETTEFDDIKRLLIHGAQLTQGTIDEGYIKTENIIKTPSVEYEQIMKLNPKFTVKEVSPSRKEVRLFFESSNHHWKGFDEFYGSEEDPYYFEDFDLNKDGVINEQDKQLWLAKERDDIALLIDDMISNNQFPEHSVRMTDKFEGLFGNIENETFTWDYILSYVKGGSGYFKENLITNYHFDRVSTKPDTSLILRLNNSLPASVSTMQNVDIYKKIMDTQRYNFRFEPAKKTWDIGDPLNIDELFYEEDTSQEDDGIYEDYNQVTGSLTEKTIQQISASVDNINDDVNLNVNYNNFENHVIFGSAEEKLINFRKKCKDIEDNLNKLSQSLSSAGTFHLEKRKKAFKEVQEIINNFTTYEKWLYYDNQSVSTASVPSLGLNLAPSIPVSLDQPIGTTDTVLHELSNHDGFSRVFEHNSTGSSDSEIGIYTGKYHAHYPPFYGYSGSVYLTWLMNAHSDVSMSLRNKNDVVNNVPTLPSQSWSGYWINKPNLSGSQWNRYTVVASQSYWRPTSVVGYDANLIESNSATHWEILSGSNVSGSYPIKDSSGILPVHPGVTQSANFFSGSIKPAGELFNIYYNQGANITSSYITDVRISYVNPTGSLPFGQVFSTGSAIFEDWYNGMISSASVYDDLNIHSFKNNLPSYLLEEEGHKDMYKFLNMIGEHFDHIRNYIDNYSNIYSRNYKNYNVVSGSQKLAAPQNLLPILAENFGWEFMNPFSASLSSYFEVVEGSDKTLDDLTNATWTKILNNLMYIYKTKGTLRSIRGMFNVFGYPADILNIHEYGGSQEESNPNVFTNEVQYTFDIDSVGGNVVYTQEQEQFRSLILDGDRYLGLDWQSNDASGESIEFIFKSQDGLINQELLKSSGSGTETLWDLRLIPSGSSGSLGKLEFRLNNSYTGGLDIATNGVSMSTAYVPLKNGEYWNVLLQRTTGSTDSTISQSYMLWTGMGKGTKINHLTTGSMTINGNDQTDGKASSSNYNFTSTGSRHYASASNLFVGQSMTGSIAEFHLWGSGLSGSKFKQHILNKKGIGGNTIDSANAELIYQYKLNEGYQPGTSYSNLHISDSKYFVTKDYTKQLPNIFTSSAYQNNFLYQTDTIDFVKLSVRIGGDEVNSNKIYLTTASESKWVRDLNPLRPSIQRIESDLENKRKTDNTRVEIVRSPADVVNRYIVNNIPDGDVADKFGDPSSMYEPRYYDLETLKKTYYTGLDININEYIEAQSKILNNAVITNVKKLLPARVDFNRVGVAIKPTLLERNKMQIKRMSVKDISPYVGEYMIPDPIPTETLYPVFEGTDSAVKLSFSGSKRIDYSGWISQSLSYVVGEYRDDIGELEIDKTFTLSGSTRDLSGNFSMFDNLYNIKGSHTKYEGKYNLNDIYSLSGSRTNFFGSMSFDNYWETSGKYQHITNLKDFNIGHIFGLSGSTSNLVGTMSIKDEYNDISSTYLNYFGQTLFFGGVDPIITMSAENISPYEDEIELTPTGSYVLTGSYLDKNAVPIKLLEDHYTLEGNTLVYGDQTKDSGSSVYLPNEYLYPNSYGKWGKRDYVEKKWGRGDNDVWYLNLQPSQSLTGSTDMKNNTWHIDHRAVFHLIGDVESISGSNISVLKASSHLEGRSDRELVFDLDLTNTKNHKNREIRSGSNFVSTYIYESFIGDGATSGKTSINFGRPVGRTYYFATQSNGDIIYPVNHIRKIGTSKSAPWMNRLCYEGVKNGTKETFIVPGTKGKVTEERYNGTILQTPPGADWEDLSSASFYTVNVTGKNKLKVERGFNTLGPDNKLKTRGGGGLGGAM